MNNEQNYINRPQFRRTRLLIGDENFKELNNSFVVVVGLGAVGGYAAEALARSGVGRIRVVDFDTVCETNINRQIYALHSTIGRHKAEVAAERISQINPCCRVEPLTLFTEPQTIPKILDGHPDIIIDAIDSLNPKVELLAQGRAAGLTILSSMGAALRLDVSEIQIASLNDTKYCPLARLVRKRLRRRGADTNITCVYSKEPTYKTSIKKNKQQNPLTVGGKKGRPRDIMGSLPTVPGIFGLILANEAIKILSGLNTMTK
ncbi:Molybdopterin-synthase adenylyltransferase [Limihaloglobus sulfuriphilus]|uniref:Molybdopterin-synthase adenylyltransferase n=1 Tax=Limihaloglobus sulfuriphilus TaxID=1851148 RepID=A0A1Q2MBC4_9BACT|nr:tRNA threonylcarbamoyladenosine dehydratase [Limihaloglobus sulfuriphilus]AQQ69974.1 Molybdopterin-synthase adenylyltransferase [Limihaloglobus sulfuriphilus]